MGWYPSRPVARRKRVSFTTKFLTASPTPPFLLESASHGAEILHWVTWQPFWPSLPLTFVRQEKSPERLTSSADQWRSNIACSSSLSSVFTKQSPHVRG